MKNNLDYILSPQCVRDKSKQIFELTLHDKTHFKFHSEKLKEVVNFVLDVTKKNYPDLNIPFHSRWGHFKVGGIDRLKLLNEKISHSPKDEIARTKLDLAVVSVLLDAGAGMQWKFNENNTFFSKSEGLAVASFYMFLTGRFSTDSQSPRVDAERLMQITEDDLISGFQVSEKNPLVGVSGRARLLNNLGKVLKTKSDFFPLKRPGSIYDYLTKKYGNSFFASQLLRAVLDGFGDIWPSRISLNGHNLGDVWKYSSLKSQESNSELVAFHKLSQWLTYSLIEPIEESGVKVQNVSELTGLAEYRNGGLLIDTGLITVKDPSLLNIEHAPSSDFVIEWRALTVYLLDLIGSEVRKELKFSPEEFPLAKILEGGTWWAGRKIAASKRADGGPPVKIKSDGTVF